MKNLFILIVMITSNDGTEYSNKVTGEVWLSAFDCKQEQANFKALENKRIKFKCIPYYPD